MHHDNLEKNHAVTIYKITIPRIPREGRGDLILNFSPSFPAITNQLQTLGNNSEPSTTALRRNRVHRRLPRYCGIDEKQCGLRKFEKAVHKHQLAATPDSMREFRAWGLAEQNLSGENDTGKGAGLSGGGGSKLPFF